MSHVPENRVLKRVLERRSVDILLDVQKLHLNIAENVGISEIIRSIWLNKLVCSSVCSQLSSAASCALQPAVQPAFPAVDFQGKGRHLYFHFDLGVDGWNRDPPLSLSAKRTIAARLIWSAPKTLPNTLKHSETLWNIPKHCPNASQTPPEHISNTPQTHSKHAPNTLK